ncbi:MAG TPA: hypothetical protein VFI16_09045 [Anaeromyxobacteraceae bacterium]|nr:hypothetical protein [Anaeromyxobacteraceae bacterium]
MATWTRKSWLTAAVAGLTVAAGCTRTAAEEARPAAARDDGMKDQVMRRAEGMIREGRRTFRFDTFGDEAFWTDTLKLNAAVEKVSPRTALAVGLKVDVDALPRTVVDAIQAGQVNLDDPAVTAALLRLDAVVGLKGSVDAQNRVTRLGISCALCHSSVDDSLTSGIGHRLDGWPNRDLNVGAIVNLSPDLSAVASLLGVPEAAVRGVITQWGPGKFDAAVFLDGKAVGPDGKPHPTLIPAAFGLSGVNLHTYTGWGSVPYWNAFVANLEMHGQGTFFDPRLDDAARFPVAAANGFGHLTAPPGQDRVTSKLSALHFYQLALEAPRAPEGSFDAAAAGRGAIAFAGQAKCAGCHVPPLFTEPGWNQHAAAEIGIDDFQASRSPDGRYRTTPLKGLWARMRAGNATDPSGNGHGFYHDGRFPTLLDVVNHYDGFMGLGLSPAQKSDLVEYLKSL